MSGPGGPPPRRWLRWPGLAFWGRVLVALPLVLALLHAVGALPVPLIDVMELALDDARIRAQAPRTRDARIVVVDIDERSLEAYGRFPWPRDLMAHLAGELLTRQQAGVLGFDVVFPESDNTSALPVLERLAAGPLRDEAGFQRELLALRETLDLDGRFAAALQGQRSVLGFYLSNDRGGRIQGMLPAPLEVPLGPAELDTLPVPHWDGFAGNLDVLNQASPRGGFVNYMPDADGIVRSVPLLGLWKGTQGAAQLHASLSLAMLRAWLGDARVEPVVATAAGGRFLAAVRLVHAGGTLELPVDRRGAMRVPFRGLGGPAGGSFEFISAVDVLRGTLPAASLKDKFVIVGTTVPSLADLRSTPMAAVFPGVEVHANLLSGVLDGRVVVRPDWALGYEVFVLVLLVAAGLALSRRLPAVWAISATVLLGAGFVLLDAALLSQRGWLLPLASPLVTLAATAVLSLAGAYWLEGRARRAMENLFGTYVPPEIVARMASAPQTYARAGMGAENRELTILFCDLRNFTTAAQSMSPDALREVVNLFFSRMTAVIRDHGGTLDKFIGDAIMAFWGAPLEMPDHARRAVAAAQAMCREVEPINQLLRERGLPPIGLGIGLNTGVVCVGDLGSALRRSYTVIGDAVNLASRIEGLTREYSVDLLVGEATRDAVGDRTWCEIDQVRVKGRESPVRLFTPLDPALADNADLREELRAWSLALAAYRRQDWSTAEEILRRLVALPGAARRYHRLLDLVDHLRQHPPGPDWDGVHRFESK